MAPLVTLEQVNKRYPDGHHAVQDVSFSIEEGKTLVLLGTSGCGKTTLLKMINRLIEPTSGSIHFKGKDTREWDLIELRRNIGFVVQSIALFPHMTIWENVALIPRLKGGNQQEINARVEELLSLVHLPPETFAHRYPRELSGGQQQRVGVIRALAANPDLILMDEPFGALDPITRTQIQDEFVQMKNELGKTIIIVTHDLGEATKLGDLIALIDGGRVVQFDTPENLIGRPVNKFVRDFFSLHQAKRLPSSLTAAEIAVTAGEERHDWPMSLQGTMAAFDAISTFLQSGQNEIPIRDDHNILLGVLNKEAIMQIFNRDFWDRKEDQSSN